MRSVLLIACSCFAATLCAEVVDRIVASVGKQVVTLSDVQREQRMVCFLDNSQPVLNSPDRIRELAAKLVDRILIRHEMESGVFPRGPQELLDASLLAVRKRFTSPAEYSAALVRCGVTDREITDYLGLQSQILDFIDFRVKPGIEIDPAAIQRYYDGQLIPASRARNEPVPPLDSVRDKIAALIADQQANQRLDAWLKELRSQAEIRIR